MRKSLRALSKRVATITLDISYKAKTDHVGSALSIVELMTVLYAQVPSLHQYKKENRDRFILSKGHAAASLYVLLYTVGGISKQELDSFGMDGGLCLHPIVKTQGIELTTGSLGIGLGVGVGMAIAQRKKKPAHKTWVLVSDGECGEGSLWEAAQLAGRLRLNNLIVLVDSNGWQCYGKVQEVTGPFPLAEKWSSFGWKTIEVDGHNVNEIQKAVDSVVKRQTQPVVIIGNTHTGHRVSLIADKQDGHYHVFSDVEYKKAREEIEEQ